MDQELFDKVMAGFEKEREPKRTVGGTIKDVGISLGSGLLDVPGMGLGLLRLSQVGSEGAEQAIGGSDNALVRAAGTVAGSALNPIGGLWRLDRATGGHMGRAVNKASDKIAGWQEALEDKYSDAQKAANQRVEDAEGFWGTTRAALQNPSTIAHMAIQSLPTMWGGAKAGQLAVKGGLRALEKAGSKGAARLFEESAERAGKKVLNDEGRKVAARYGARLGEGMAAGGVMAEQIGRENGGAPLTAGQGLAVLAAGAGTSALGALGSAVGRRFGATDIDEMFAGGLATVGRNGERLALQDAARAAERGITARQLQAGIKAEGRDFVERQIARQLVAGGEKLSAKQIAKGIAAGTFSEGVLEELPQSMQEQVWQNIATGKAWDEGVLEAGAQGMLTGGLMGAGANVRASLPGNQRRAMAAHAAEAAREAAKERKERLQAYAQWRTSPEGRRTRAILAGQHAGRTAAELEKARREAAYWEQLRTGHAAPGEMETQLGLPLEELPEELREQYRQAEERYQERQAAAGPGMPAWERQRIERGRAAEQQRTERRQAEMAAAADEAFRQWQQNRSADNALRLLDALRQVREQRQAKEGIQDLPPIPENWAEINRRVEEERAARNARHEAQRQGYQGTGEGLPVDRESSPMYAGQTTPAMEAEEARLEAQEAEAARLAARRAGLEEAFSQPATTPRYEAVALEDADIAARQRKTERQAQELEAERAYLEELSSRIWGIDEVPPELAERLAGLRRQMNAGEAGYKSFVRDEADGSLIRVDGVKSTYPEWMRKPNAREAEADPDRALLSGAGKEGIETVLRKWEQGKPLTDNQHQVWSALQRKAWRHGMDDYAAQGLDSQEYADIQYAEKRGMTLEQPHEVAAGSLQDGDTVLVRDREGEIDAATVNDDPSTGTITIKDGVVRRYGYGDPVQIEGRKSVERPEESAIAAMFADQEAQVERNAALEAQAASGTIGKALAAGDILIGEQQPGLGIGVLMGQANSPSPLRGQPPLGGGQDAPVATAAQAAPAGENAPSGEGIAALLGTLDAARRERGRAERPQRRQEQREAKAQRVKAAKHRQHEARFAEIGAPYHRSFAGEANWNGIIPNAQGFIEETRGRERQARQDLARGAYGTAYGTNASDAADTALAEGRRQQRRNLARSAYGTGFGTNPDRAAERVIAERNQQREQAASGGTQAQEQTPAQETAPANPERQAFIDKLRRTGTDRSRATANGETYNIDESGGRYTAFDGDGNVVGSFDSHEAAVTVLADRAFPQTTAEESIRDDGRPARRPGESLPEYNKRYREWAEAGRPSKAEQELAGMSGDDIASLVDEVAAEMDAPQPKKPAKEKLKPITEEELAHLFGEDGQAGVKPKKRKPAGKKTTGRTGAKKTASQAAKEGAAEALAAMNESLEGLRKLFAGKGMMGAGLVFDEDTYREAKPHFVQAWEHAKRAGKSLRDFVRILMENFGGTQTKPYVIRFLEDVQNNNLETEEEANGAETEREAADGPAAQSQQDDDDVAGNRPGALEAVPAEVLRGDGRGGPERAGDRSGAEDAGRDSGADAARVPVSRGGRDGAGEVRAGETGSGRGRGKRGVKTGEPDPNQTTSPAAIPARNFRITPELELGKGGPVQKYNDNIAAIRTLKRIQAEGRRATPEEQAILARYVGWGGLADAFRRPDGSVKEGWEKRVEEVEALLTPEELKTARSSTQNAHYTSQDVVAAVWRGMMRLGFKGGNVLEPSVGTGNFLGLMPQELAGSTRFTASEFDNITAAIAGLLYPQENIRHTGFEKLPLVSGSIDAMVGNPPFGQTRLVFSSNPRLNRHSIHNQFVLASLESLRPGGVMGFVVSRYLMDNRDDTVRREIAKLGKLLGAIRLPGTAFAENARTEVVTDIIFLQRYTKEEQEAYDPSRTPEWIGTTDIMDDNGQNPMPVNNWFAGHPERVLGELNRQGSMWRENDIGVTYNGRDMAADLNAMIDRMLPENAATGFDPKRSEQAHQEMVEHMGHVLSGKVVGDVSFNEAGELTQIYDRESVSDSEELVLTSRTLTPESPWSDDLTQAADGRWYEDVDKLGPDGKPLKVRGKDGRPTNRNQKERRWYNEDEIPANKRLGETGYERLRDAAGLLDTLREQIRLETEDAPEAEIEANRKKLNRAYDDFTRKHNGYLNDPHNARLIEEMAAGSLLLSLENNYRKKAKGRPAEAVKADILTRRVNFPAGGEIKVRDAGDALGVNLSEMGRVDIGHIAGLLGKSHEEVIAELCDDAEKPLIFFDPETQLWTKADEYLSGNVRRKLNAAVAARDAAAAEGASQRELKRWEKTVAALQAVQPKRWESHQITAIPGASWIPPDVYADFYAHLTGGKAEVEYLGLTHTFGVTVSDAGGRESSWSTPDRSAADLLNALLNSRTVKITRRVDGKTYSDPEASQACNDKIQEIKEEFANWVFGDAERRERLTDIFNDRYNVRVVKQNDGSHLKLPGKVPDSIIKMRRHQLNAIWRGIMDKFVLYDHAVGAGKTFTGIARAMERKRMGLSRKPMIVVPNHLVNQFASDVYRLYPGAKVLAAGKADMERSKRRRLFGRIATGDWDIVIVPHSSFGFIGIDPSTEESYIEAELEQVYEAIVELKEMEAASGGRPGKSPAVKAAEALRDKLEARLEKLRAKNSRKDRLLTFEQMGVDDLTVDEAHEFKNLFYNSNMQAAGMNPRAGSAKAYDLWTKARVLRESGGSVAFMTGTPISNSAVEMYTMMRYLAADELAELGLENFDAWRTQFVEASTAFEPTESGSGLKEVTRLGREWNNMRSLMDLYYSFADCVSNEDIQQWYLEDTGEEFPLPKVKGGGRQSVNVEPTPEQARILDEIISGFNGLKGIKNIKLRNAERLRLMDRARKVSLDARAVDPNLPGDEGGKIGAVTERVHELYRKYDRVKGTQLVFLDRSVPKASGDAKLLDAYDKLLAALETAERDGDEAAARKAVEDLEKYDANEMEEIRRAQQGGWTAYQQIKDNLVALGIPANEIRFVQEANTDAQKQDLFDAVKRGEVRVLIGSSQRMGAGTNVQDRLVALHHVDVGWKPSDIEQREGRIIRQGNLFATEGSELYDPNFQVEILAYTTERTVDAKMWSLNSTKLKMINGIRKYGGEFNMEFDDSDSVGMAEIAAIASGDPMQLERVQLASEIERLERQKRGFQRQMFATQDAIKRAERSVENLPDEIAFCEKYGPQAAAGLEEERRWKQGLSVVIDGETYTGETRKEAQAYVAEAVRETNESQGKVPLSVEIDGVKYHAQGKIDAALEEKLGDNGVFAAELNGVRYASAALMRRRIAELVNTAVKGKPDEADDLRIGTIKKSGLEFELSLSTEMTTDRRGTPYKAAHFYIEQKVERGEAKHRLISSYSGAFLPGGETLNLASIPGLFTEIIKDAAALSGRADGLRRLLSQAEKALPNLREEAKKTFPKQAELEQKKKRLAEVEQTLNAQAKAAESGYSAPAAASLRDEIEAGAGLDIDGTVVRDAKLSMTAVPVGDRADIEAELASAIGKTWANKILHARNGHIRIIETQEEARRLVGADNETVKQSENGTIQGFYLNGVAYLVRDGIARGNVMAVLMHEYGEHAAQLGFRNNVGYRAILKSLENRQNEDSATGKAIQEAMKRVPEGTPKEHYWSEVAAYIVEANADIKTTTLDRVTNFFKKWLFKVSGLGADNFTHKDLVLFARAAVKAGQRAGAGENARATVESFDSRGETLQPAFMSIKGTKDKLIAAAAEQMGIPLEQLQAEYEAVAKRHAGQPRNAPNGKASNLTEEQWVLARTPSFLRRYGNWAYNPDAPVAPVDLSGVTEISHFTEMKQLREWVKAKYIGQTVTINSDGAVVGFTVRALKDSLKRGVEEKRTAYAKLDELIQNSLYFDFEENDGLPKHKHLDGQDVYYSAMKVGEKLYSVRFKFDIAKDNSTRVYKDHKVVDIKISPAVHAGEAQQGSTPPRSGDGEHSSLVYHAQAQNDSGAPHARTEEVLSVTVGDLTAGVKPGKISIPLDANGEPTASAFPNTTGGDGGPGSGQTSGDGPRFSIAASPSAPAATPPNPANNNAVTGQSFIDRILDNAAPKWRDRWERFIYNFLDSNDPRERVWRRAGAPSDKDFVTIERLRGKKAAAEQKRFQEEMVTPLLKTLGNAGLSASDLEEYAHALHTPERNQRMREVNAKRTLDELIKQMPDRDAQDIKDQIDFIRTVGKQNGWTESDIQKAYLDLMRDVFNNIPARERAQRAAERALSPNSSQAQIDRVAKGAEQLAETKRIRDKWQEESIRFAGMTDADAASIIQKWQGDGRYAALQKAQRQLADITAATLDVLHEAGELGDEEYQAMKNGYQFYVPLHRDGFQDTRPPAVGRSTGPIGSPFKVAKGSMRAVVNILANTVRAHETAINRRHKLEAGRALYEFAQAHPDAGITVERQEKKPTHDKEGNIVMYTSQAEPEDGVFVKVDGVKYLLRFNTDTSTPEGRTLARFLDSVKGADAQLGGMVKMLHTATRYLAAVNTSFSPEFVVTNFSRDFQTAFIHLNQENIDQDGLKRAVAKDVFPAMRGIFAAQRGNKNSAMARWFADFEANGGKVGWMQSYEHIEDLANKLNREMKLHQKGHHAYKAWRGMKDLVEHANAAIENCMRLATYKNLVERGVSKQQAARVASALTVDFTQHGKMSPQINSLYMFFNASVQGTVRMVQAMATSKKVQAIAGGIAGAGFVLQMLALAGGGDDDSGEPNIFGIPESTRERNIIIMLPGGDGKKYIKIPKAYGYGALYDFGAELANSIYMSANGRKYDHAKGAMRVVSSFANSFNPIQSATLLQALSPTLLDPVVYTAENKTWAGTPLMPEQSPYGPPKPDSERYWKGTSPIFKQLSRFLNQNPLVGGDSYSPGRFAAFTDISPETFSMLWDTGMGGMGRFVGNTVALPFTLASGDTEARKVPFLRQVYGEWNDRAISSRYYEAMDRAETAHMRFKNAENLTERKRLYQEPDHKLYLQSRQSEKLIKRMRKRQQLMEAAGNKDGAERMRQRIVEEQAKVLKMAA